MGVDNTNIALNEVEPERKKKHKSAKNTKPMYTN